MTKIHVWWMQALYSVPLITHWHGLCQLLETGLTISSQKLFKRGPLLKPQLNPMQQGNNPWRTVVLISLSNSNFSFLTQQLWRQKDSSLTQC